MSRIRQLLSNFLVVLVLLSGTALKGNVENWHSTLSAETHYTRGRDLSGTLQGAGGIGGLLARTDHALFTIGNPNAHAFYHADANGNVTALINAYQAIVARYWYDPFGSPVLKCGPLADANVYQHSSKEFSLNSGLYSSLYRFYDPSLPRWLNEDPSGESGGINLYSYVGNSPVNAVDPYGLLDYYMSKGGFLQPAGPVPYLEADTILGSLAAGAYNAIPFLDNALFGPILNIGTTEGDIAGNGGDLWQMGPALTLDAFAAAGVVLPGLMQCPASSVALAETPLILQNAANGQAFEGSVLSALGATKNTVSVTIDELGTSIPDIIDQSGNITEIKNSLNLSFTRQLQIQAQGTQDSFNLIVSPRTQYISQPLQDAVQASGGTIQVFDPATGAFTPWP